MEPEQPEAQHMGDYNIAVIGAGPSGLSAAGRAAKRDGEAGNTTPTHVLLEGFARHAKTIQQYQKGKYVMAEPGYLDLRSDFPFDKGSREEILGYWESNLSEHKVNIEYGAEVTAVSGSKDNFTITLSNGSSVTANNIVLSIGVQGNPRKLGVPGSEHPLIQYQLDDPEEYSGEHIIVVGAGDAAIENAVALTAQNRVTILNRKDEFIKAKPGNIALIIKAISDPNVPLDCLYSSSIKEIDAQSDEGEFTAIIDTPDGELPTKCNRVIARLGAIPQRKFVESMGIEFPNESPEALPELDRQYQSNVPGIYIIGALAGCPLIKQAMNQGYDVVEFINGNDIEPADQPLLEKRFAGLPFSMGVDQLVDRLQTHIPMFRQLNSLQFRELLIESEFIASYAAGNDRKEAEKQLASVQGSGASDGLRITKLIDDGSIIYEPGTFGTSVFTVLAGSVTLTKTAKSGELIETTLERGDFFGEMSLLSGHPRLETAKAGQGTVLAETPRRIMLKLVSSNDVVRDGVEWIFIVRELQRHFAPNADAKQFRSIAAQLEIVRLKASEILYSEGDTEECFYLLKSGGITLTRQINNQKTFISQQRTGSMIGQLAMFGDPQRRITATATVATEVIRIDQKNFARLVEKFNTPMDALRSNIPSQELLYAHGEVRPESGAAMAFLMNNGLGEATNTLIIDESLCVGCDNCEKACAETHEGIKRLNRKYGPTFGNIHIATACRHCEQPHCMKDCPPNAIKRAESGEVFIDDSCIGCGNCQSNCPYGDENYSVIRMEKPVAKKPGLLSWMLFGAGSAPGEPVNAKPLSPDSQKKAVKCDACVNLPGPPACVQACPTGAAMRLGPLDYSRLVEERSL